MMKAYYVWQLMRYSLYLWGWVVKLDGRKMGILALGFLSSDLKMNELMLFESFVWLFSK